MGRRLAMQGVSLIEALVALAVMGFGLLGVVGLQATLRYNADVSKQRSEAVRMAQQELERLRSFARLNGAPAGERDYDSIASIPATAVTQPAGYENTTFTRTVTVVNPTALEPLMKTVTVKVGWQTRRATGVIPDETVSFTSTIARVSPELSASLGLPGDRSAIERPRGRRATIPNAAVDQPNGTSIFSPPGSTTGMTWTFVNASGQIILACTTPGTCTAVTGWLLSGYVRFATGLNPATTVPAVSETPSSVAFLVGVKVNRMAPVGPASPTCFSSFADSLTIAYHCMVPTAIAPTTWTGTSVLTNPDGTQLTNIASSPTDPAASRFKVCRFSPTVNDNRPEAHPALYANVNSSLANQNFLVISAGNNTTAYDCPADDPLTPLFDGDTWAHQP